MLNTAVLLAKREAVPGTAIAVTGASDAHIVNNYRVTPVEGDSVRRPVDRGIAGATPSLKTRVRAKHAFDIELAGAGTATGIVKWATLLGACMFGTPTVAADVTYPLSTVGDGDALSLWGYLDSARHKGRGTRGNVKFSFAEGSIPTASFDLMSLIVANTPMDPSVAGAITLPTPPDGVEVNFTNTLVTIDGTVVGMRSFEVDMGMKTTFFSTTGGQSVIFDKADDGDRRAAGFTAVFEMPDPATKNYIPTVLSGAEVALSIVHGITVGNIIDLSSAHARLEDVSYSVESNRLFLNLTGKFVPTAAGNELVLKTR